MDAEELARIEARLVEEMRAWGEDAPVVGSGSAASSIVAYVESLGYGVTGVETEGDHVTVYWYAPVVREFRVVDPTRPAGNGDPRALGSGDE